MRRSWIHVLLFVLTVASTWFTGGPGYSITVMLILLGHELGHYFMSQKYGIRATLPYFLPAPFTLFGTFGAVIRMHSTVSSRRALFDTGAAGPMMSFVLSLPAIVIGLKLSNILPASQFKEGTLRLADPLLFSLIQRLVIGKIPETYDVVLHPVGFAGWVGLFVTALNLFPVGQLDGGHIAYALFGRKSRIVFLIAIAGVAFMFTFSSIVWLLPLVLMVLFGFRHPAPIDDQTPLDGKRRLIGAMVFLILLLSFVSAPLPQIPSLIGVLNKGFSSLLIDI